MNIYFCVYKYLIIYIYMSSFNSTVTEVDSLMHGCKDRFR